jgi:hypothetical protein
MSAHDTTPGLQRRLGRVDDLTATQAQVRDAQHLRLRIGIRGLEQNGSVATLYHHIWSAWSMETVGKIPIPFSYLYFFCRTETKTGISETETNGHIWLVGNKLNRSGLYWKRSVTGNQVGNIDQHNNI